MAAASSREWKGSSSFPNSYIYIQHPMVIWLDHPGCCCLSKKKKKFLWLLKRLVGATAPSIVSKSKFKLKIEETFLSRTWHLLIGLKKEGGKLLLEGGGDDERHTIPVEERRRVIGTARSVVNNVQRGSSLRNETTRVRGIYFNKIRRRSKYVLSF